MHVILLYRSDSHGGQHQYYESSEMWHCIAWYAATSEPAEAWWCSVGTSLPPAHGHIPDVREGAVYGKEKSNQSRKTISNVFIVETWSMWSFCTKREAQETHWGFHTGLTQHNTTGECGTYSNVQNI